MFKQLSSSLLIASICFGNALSAQALRYENPNPRPVVPGKLSYLNEGGYVANYRLSYILNGKLEEKTGALAVGQTFSTSIDPYASHIQFRVDGVAVLEPLDLFAAFSSGQSVNHCYKSWGTVFGTEWSKVSC